MSKSGTSSDRRGIRSDERMLNLLHALVDPRLRLTKNDIRAHVPGYAQANDAAFERMFERDKDALRQWGFTINVLGDGREAIYRVDLESWQAADIMLTPLELAVTGLAAHAWNSAQHSNAADLAVSARWASTKLAGRGTSRTEPLPRDLRISLRTPGPAYLPILEAAEARRAIRFDYLAASSGTRARRHVEPWEVVSAQQAWYLLGLDKDRGSPRAFRLSRIRGAVAAEGPPGAFAPPSLTAEERRDLLRPASTSVAARVAVLPERAHELRRLALRVHPAGAQDGPLADREILELAPTDMGPLVQTIAGLADAALVLDPPHLRAAVIAQLTAVAALPTGDEAER